MEHSFTPTIRQILDGEFGGLAQHVFDNSLLIQYLNLKTKSAGRGSKARASFGNLYALYVLVEDYIKRGFISTGNYSEYEGAKFSYLFARQRELPFGSKLQNHHLNQRLNGEFRKFFPTAEFEPLIRDLATTRYWINENLMLVFSPDGKPLNLATALIKIIDAYVEAKRDHASNLRYYYPYITCGG